MACTEQATSKDGTRQTWPKEVETALARGDCAALDSWLARIVPASADPQASTDLCGADSLAACLFSALFFRLPDHPQLVEWAERARESLDALPHAPRLTLARRLLHYNIFFGRPARNALLMDSLHVQGMDRVRTPATQIQWKLLQALHQNSLGTHADCLATVHRAQELSRRHDIQQWSTMLRALEVSASLGLSDWDAARRAWEAPHPEKTYHGLLGTAHLHQLGARMALAGGDPALAQEHAEAALHATTRAGAPLFHALACLTAAEVHLERGASEAAGPMLQEAEQIACVTGSAELACLGTLARAWCTLQLDAHNHSDDDLRIGFSLAARHGYKNFSWWSPRMMEMLCVKALENGIETGYVRELVQTHRLAPSSTPMHVEMWPWPVKIYTLGRFTVLTDNQPARAGRKAQHKPLELLKALIAQGGREVSEDTLTAALWPDTEGDTARQAFDTTLHRLRRLLGNDRAIVLHDRRLSLDNRLCWVDTWAFERLLSETETLLANPSADPNGAALANIGERVQSLYHGAFLGKESGASWSISLRERLRSRYLRHVVSVGARWQQLGRWNRAIDCYRKGLEVDDLAEQLYQNLMLCHQQLDQRSEALSVYRRCRFVLSVVLGIAPSPATETLRQRLRTSL